jgi:UPF0716 family protein affecting phage T7 exclusion
VIALAGFAVAVLDGWALLRLADRPDVGVGDLVVYVMFAGFLGTVVASRAAARTFGALRHAAASGAPAGPVVVEGLVTLTASGLLAWPGPVSDAVAITLLVPWISGAVARRAHARGRTWLDGRGIFVGGVRPPSWGADTAGARETHDDAPRAPRGRGDRGSPPRFDHPVA